MGYFANGTEGDLYEALYCANCVNNREKIIGTVDCPIRKLHLMFNYKDCNNKDSYLHVLIPRSGVKNEQCTMFLEREAEQLNCDLDEYNKEKCEVCSCNDACGIYNMQYETTYGHCIAKNPYWFIPDLECNTKNELSSWRHALFAVKQGTFENPQHYFWKTVEVHLTKEKTKDFLDECGGVIYMTKEDDGKVTIHGHNTPWGMGISAFSDKINVWEEYSYYKWILELAESDATDQEFIAAIKEHEERRKQKYEEYRHTNIDAGVKGQEKERNNYMIDRYTFRGKRTLNGEWIYGSLIQKDTMKIFHKVISLDNNFVFVHSDVIPKTVGRCTDFKDKNGKLIYEGDITELELQNGEKRCFEVAFKKVKRTVASHPTFDEPQAKVEIYGVVFLWRGFELFPCIDENDVDDTYKMTIVGNIYDNFELLSM